MATLFFDGFDRGTVLGRLDPQYWSTQYRSEPGYALGGYSYDHNSTNYSNQYKTVGVNNGTLPSGQFSNGESVFIASNYYGIPGNNYPGFGSAPGFLSLSNIPVNDTNFLAPLTYIQLSGFPQPSGNKAYFGARFLGLETKHTDYDSRIDPTRVDKPGRFDYRHPLLAFCGGNTTGLLMSIVKATGNNLALLENQKMTMGLQIEQNGNILGVFDLNMNDTINQYSLTSVFHDHVGNATLNDIGGKILTIADIRTQQPGNCSNCGRIATTMLVSRWAHLEFLIDKNLAGPYLAVKIEGVDVPIIDIDDTNSDKETWLLEMPISGFYYDNIRFYNRTYYKDLYPDWSIDSDNKRYYGKGSVTLVDDVTFIDDIDQPGFWLGPTVKVLPLSPGMSTNLDNNGNIIDGLREWTTNSSSHRRALKNFDGDIGVLETTVSGAITAVRYDNHNFGGDSASVWRTQFNDGIAGIKVYNNARKNFLDTQFTNVFFTGISDDQAAYTQLLINTDRDIYDVTNKNIISKIEPVSLSYDIQKFDDPSVYFPNNDSYLYITYGDLHKVDISLSVRHPPPENFFTIESWVYFQNGNENISLYSKKPPSSYPQITDLRLDVPLTNFDIVCTTGYIQYSTYIDDVLLGYRRLYFPSPISTGTWNHVALVNDAIQDFRGRLIDNQRYYDHQYRLTTYLNGVSGTAYSVWNSLDGNLPVYGNNPYGWSPLPVSYSMQNLDLPNSGVEVLVSAGSLTGIGNNLSPITGLWTEYFPSIKVPDNATWSERINIPTTITLTNFYDLHPDSNSNNTTYTLASSLANGKPRWISSTGPWGVGSFEIRWDGSSWGIHRPAYRGGYCCPEFIQSEDTVVPLKTNWFNTQYTPNSQNSPSNGQLSYTFPIDNMPPLNISSSRCNNRLAYLITSAGLPELTGLYCLDGIFNNAYYYINTDNPDYYLYNPSYLGGARRWVIGSGLYNNNQFNDNFYAKYVCDQIAPTTETLLSAQSLYESSLKIVVDTTNNNNATFTILKNNIAQRNLSRNSDGRLSGILPISSGDTVLLKVDYGTYPSLTITNPPSLSLSISLSSPIEDGLYYLPIEYPNVSYYGEGNIYVARPVGIVGKFVDDYTSSTDSNNNFPLFIGGAGYIDNYRFTHGTTRVDGLQSRTRYSNNFTVINEPFPSVYNDYQQVGDIHTLTRTRYNTIQYFAMNNPATQQPWTTGLIETSGFLFGVKKL